MACRHHGRLLQHTIINNEPDIMTTDSSSKIHWYPLVVIVLLAALALVFSLLVMEKARQPMVSRGVF